MRSLGQLAKLDLEHQLVGPAHESVFPLELGTDSVPIGFVEFESDVGGLIQGFHDGLPAFGVLARLYPFTYFVKSTWFGKFLVAKPEDRSSVGRLLQFRDKLYMQRRRDIEEGKAGDRIDLLQQ